MEAARKKIAKANKTERHVPARGELKRFNENEMSFVERHSVITARRHVSLFQCLFKGGRNKLGAYRNYN